MQGAPGACGMAQDGGDAVSLQHGGQIDDFNHLKKPKQSSSPQTDVGAVTPGTSSQHEIDLNIDNISEEVNFATCVIFSS